MLKRQLLIVGQAIYGHLYKYLSLNSENCIIFQSSTIENLGGFFHPCLTLFLSTNTAFFHFRNIIRPTLSLCDAKTIIHACVSSRLNYCNVLFSGLPSCATGGVHLVQNTAARILTKTRKYDHITLILSSLHWLPVQFKFCFFGLCIRPYMYLNHITYPS